MHTLMNIFVATWDVLGEMAIYLLFGFFIAGILSVLISPETVERHLGGRGIWPVIKATLVGVPLPLCSCGVIPVAASLRKHGASRGATTAFLMSTPQTGVDSLLVTYSLLGAVFALIRPVVATISGVVGGLLVENLDRRPSAENGGSVETRCEDACCAFDGRQKHGRMYRVLEHGFITLPADIAWQLLAGVLLAGLISALVPPHVFSHSFLGGGLGAMVAMMLVGIPSYVCASASVPLALAMINLGISPGAVLVFLITGPASNAASIVTMGKILGRRATLIYLATVAGTALAAGLALDYLFTFRGVPAAGVGGHDMLPGYVKTMGAVTLLALLLIPPLLRWWRARRESALDRRAQAVILTVAGMSCHECAQTVREALLNCDRVDDATVNLRTGEVRVRGDHPNIDDLRGTVRRLGFSVKDN